MYGKVIQVLLFFNVRNVFTQVCARTKINWQDVPETIMYTYKEAYDKDGCLFWCTDTRIATATTTKIVSKQVAVQEHFCCEGYIEKEPSNNRTNDDSLHCVPVCIQECVNGYCKAPGVCACNPGYLPDHFEPNKCVPFCLHSCEPGICTASNICECPSGYEFQNNRCEPKCSSPCKNATCVAPDICQCLPGFKKTYNDICEPYCSSYTASGECISTIKCEQGWEKVVTEINEECRPICSQTCLNGHCIAPGVCECIDGYRKKSNACEPFCTSGCRKGYCISPEMCACEPGWFWQEYGRECLPHCDQFCGNGTCVAPNVCECSSGYIVDESRLLEGHGSPLCVPICANCKKPCFSLENCVCPEPMTPVLLTATGKLCDCLNCTENQCKKAVCHTNGVVTVPDEKYVKPVTFDRNATEINSDTTELAIISTTLLDNDISTDSTETDTIQFLKASWFDARWVYILTSALVMASIIIILVIILKKKHSASRDFLESQQNTSESSSAVVHYQNNKL